MSCSVLLFFIRAIILYLTQRFNDKARALMLIHLPLSFIKLGSIYLMEIITV